MGRWSRPRAFGATERQLLWKVQVPLAMPTIMAGVNQTLMMSLSMVVIASMISVGGLGQMVLRGIGRLDVGLAAVGGLGIVMLAIILDRMTQVLSETRRRPGALRERGPIGFVRRHLGGAAPSRCRSRPINPSHSAGQDLKTATRTPAKTGRQRLMNLHRTAKLVAGHHAVLSAPSLADETKPSLGFCINEALVQTFIVMEGLRDLGYQVADVSQAQGPAGACRSGKWRHSTSMPPIGSRCTRRSGARPAATKSCSGSAC